MERVSFTAEFLFKASPAIIYKFLTSADCIIRWFCDECKIIDGRYSFVWDGNVEEAIVLEDREDECLRLQWDDAESDEEYLEFNLGRSEVTGETIVKITAFCDDDEVEEEKQFWSTQMDALHRATGG